MTWLHRVEGVRRMAADAAASLLLRPGHTIGMIAGIALGVAGVVGIAVIADTQQVQIDRQFDLQRSDRVVVRAHSATPSGFAPELLGAVARLEPVTDVGEFSIWSGAQTVSRTDDAEQSSRPVLVVDGPGLRATETRVVVGRPGDEIAAESGPVAWIGEALARDLGIRPDDVGSAEILVGGFPLRVVGIVANATGFGYTSSAVLMSRKSAVATIGGVGENIRVIAHVRPGSASAVGEYMVAGLDPHRELSLDDVTPPDGKILLKTVASDLRRIGVVLGGFMAVVALISVANTLMMSVYQRRRELGLRSAIGWKRRRIGALVFTESAIAGVVASILGAGVGAGAATIWCLFQGWELILAPWLPFAATGAGLMAGILGGVIPAYVAASTAPMTAMRS